MMKNTVKKPNRDPEAVKSLRQFFRDNLRDDLPKDLEIHVNNLVNLVLDIADGDFQCSACSKKYHFSAVELDRMPIRRWL